MVSAVKTNYAEVREASRNHFLGVPYTQVQPSALAVAPRSAAAPSTSAGTPAGSGCSSTPTRTSCSTRRPTTRSPTTSASGSTSGCRTRRRRDAAAPKGYAYGTKRPPLETNYYEAFNRDSVSVVDMKTTPIDEITQTGVGYGDRRLRGRHHRARNRIRRDDRSADGHGHRRSRRAAAGREVGARPKTYLGMMVNGFPNLFLITGPQSPSVLYNMPLAIEDHVDFATDAIDYMGHRELDVIEPTLRPRANGWPMPNEIATQTLLPGTNSWYMGANIPGKPRACMVYLGGAPTYRATCDEVVAGGYSGFTLTAPPAPPCPEPAARPRRPNGTRRTRSRTDRRTTAQGLKAFEHSTVEEARAVVATFTGLQAPPEPVARVEDADYESGGAQIALRVYVPEGDGPHPVVLYFHGGGFVAGDLDVVDEPARAVANGAGAIVVAATYRRAPEHRFPAAADDASAALQWVADHVGSYGGDPGNVVVMGDSAGGNLAAVTALRARDEGGPRLRGQVLVYPVIDPNARPPVPEGVRRGVRDRRRGPRLVLEQLPVLARGRGTPHAVPSQAGSLGACRRRSCSPPRTRCPATKRRRTPSGRRGRRRHRGDPLRRADSRRVLDVRGGSAQRRAPRCGDAISVQAIRLALLRRRTAPAMEYNT